MAGERKGKTYEALIKAALDRLKSKGALNGKVLWNVKAAGMTVTPDFTIGQDADHPDFVLLITHSGSAKESEKKNWRNLGELAECKLRLKTVPKVFSVAFDSVVKENLKAVATAAFDGQLIVGDRPYGPKLVKWIDENHGSLPADTDEKVEALYDLFTQKDPKFTPLFTDLLADLKALLSKTNPALNSLWAMERKRQIGKAPTARTTFVRRGLSKLLIFEDVNQALQIYRGKRVSPTTVPQYAFDLELATKSVGRTAAADQEIASAVSVLTDTQIKSILAGFDVSKISAWLTTLRNAPHLKFMGDYVAAEYANLCDPAILLQRLRELHTDPCALIDKTKAPANWPPGEVWLFTFLIEVLKAGSTMSNGFGYAKLAVEVSKKAGMPKGNDRVYTIVLSDWLLRRGKESMAAKILREICSVVAEGMRALNANIKTAVTQAAKDTVTNVIESKLCCYRSFDPLESLIASAVARFSPVIVRSCYAQAAGDPGQAGLIQVGNSKSTIINWQSASDAGKDHKVKELCGRAAALRYSWDSKAKTFVPRAGVEKLCLVVDGTWTQEDLDTLVLAGWDEIFYPDEMERLAKAIV